MEDSATSRSESKVDAGREADVDIRSNATEDGSFGDEDDASIGGATARHSSHATLSRDKAKSLSRLPFADKQHLVRQMFLRREQSGKGGLPVHKDNAGTSTSGLEDGGIEGSGRGSPKRIKRKGVPLAGLNAMDEEHDLPGLAVPRGARTRPRGRGSVSQEGSDTDDGGSLNRPRSDSPSKAKGKRVPLKSGEESQASKKGEQHRISRDKPTSHHEHKPQQVSGNASSNSQQSNSGQSITIRLPPQAVPSPVQPSLVQQPGQTSALPISPFYAASSSATDKLLLRQTVSSFEQCLHHALDMNVVLLAQITKQQHQSAPTFLPNSVSTLLATNSAMSNRSPQKPSNCASCVVSSPAAAKQQQSTQQAIEYAQGLGKIKELIGRVQANTSRQAKVMDAMVQAVNVEQERRAADEIKALVTQLAGGAGAHGYHRAGGNAGNVSRLGR